MYCQNDVTGIAVKNLTKQTSCYHCDGSNFLKTGKNNKRFYMHEFFSRNH